MRLAIALCLLASPLAAQEFLSADTRLSDDDFYRLVACAAPVSGVCQKDIVRWSPADAQDVSIGIVQVAEGYPPQLLKTIDAALDAVINEVNAAGANLHLTRSELSTIPDVGIHLLDIVEGDVIDGTGLDPLDGQIIEAAKAQLWWRDDLTVIEGAIVFGTDVDPNEVGSIMLEEVTQTMGLLTDIGGPYYQSRSIFSETSNELTRLGSQDVMALRRHYP
jgi:hypothetical protein